MPDVSRRLAALRAMHSPSFVLHSSLTTKAFVHCVALEGNERHPSVMAASNLVGPVPCLHFACLNEKAKLYDDRCIRLARTMPPIFAPGPTLVLCAFYAAVGQTPEMGAARLDANRAARFDRSPIHPAACYPDGKGPALSATSPSCRSFRMPRRRRSTPVAAPVVKMNGGVLVWSPNSLRRLPVCDSRPGPPPGLVRS